MDKPVIQNINSTTSLSILYQISKELALAPNINTVMEKVLDLSLKMVNATSGSIILINEKNEVSQSAIIHEGKIIIDTNQRLKATLESGLAGWVIEHKEAALINDTGLDERWINRAYGPGEKQESKSTISAPLIIQNSLIGVLTISHHDTDVFEKQHLALLQSIADQSAIAIFNSMSLQVNKKRAEVMTALADSAAIITASLSLDEVLKQILSQTMQAMRVEAVSLALLDEGSAELVFKAAIGKGQEEIIGLRVKMGQGIAGWVAQEGESVIVPAVDKDPRFYNQIDENTGYKTQVIAAAPIISNNKILGVIEALNPIDPFDKEDIILLKGIGNLAGTAIEHAELFSEVESAQQRYQQLFEDSVDPIIITNMDGKIVEANRQAGNITIMPESKLISMNIHQLHQVNWDVVGLKFEKLETNHIAKYESDLSQQENDSIPIEIYLRKLKIDDEDKLQWIIRDITEFKELDKLKEDLSSMIYHDLRSPLTNIVSGLELIQSMVPEDPAIDSIIAIARRSTERIQRLADSLLDTSRLQAGQRIGNLKLTNLISLLDAAQEAIKSSLKGGEHILKLEIPDTLPDVMVDSDMIKRVIINLLENAIKYSDNQSTITLGAKEEFPFVNVWVEDNGRGISTGAIPTIFEKFSRAPGGTGFTKGLGIGLAFCKLAVEGHGGKICVESKRGIGSKFSFVIPVVVKQTIVN